MRYAFEMVILQNGKDTITKRFTVNNPEREDFQKMFEFEVWFNSRSDARMHITEVGRVE